MDEEKITLDKKTFKTLASETRVNILKSLDRRRKTLSELSKELKLSVSTVKEHMDSLIDAELVKLKDDGHKWKYYELTRKGYRILHPGETKIWILLSVSALGVIYTFYDMFRKFNLGYFQTVRTYEMASRGVEAATESGSLTAQVPLIHVTLLIVFSIVFLFSLIMLVRKGENYKVINHS